MEREVAKFIVRTYGTTGLRVMQMGKEENMNERLVPELLFTKS